MAIHDFTFDGFNTGLDTSSARGRKSPTSAKSLVNLRLRYDGTLIIVNNHEQQVDFNDVTWAIPDGFVRRLTRYFVLNDNGDSKRFIVFTPRPSLISGTTYYYEPYAYSEADGTVTSLGSIQAIMAADIQDDAVPYYILDDVQFALFYNTLIMAIPTVGLLVWYGDVSSGLDICGMNTPYSSPTINVTGTTGNVTINTTSPIQYIQWKYTFVSKNGIEGNPSPASSQVSGFTNKQVEVKIPDSLLTAESAGLSACSKCTTANIYRRGAGIRDNWYKVGSVSVTSGSVGGFYVFTDNTADIDVSTTQISNNRFMSPTYLDLVLYHNRRLYGVSSYGLIDDTDDIKNTSTTLFFSGLDKPECWGKLLDNDTAGLYGGSMSLPGLMDDGIIGLATTGNVLIVGRKKTVYAIYGNRFDNFNISQRATTGLISRRCITSGNNQVFFWGSNRRIYRVLDNGIEWISSLIQKDLDALDLNNDVVNAYMRYFDNQLYLFFKDETAANPNGYAYVFDLISNSWRKESDMLSVDACVSTSFDQSLGQTFGTNHTMSEEQMLFVNSEAQFVYLAYQEAIGESGKFAEYISPETAIQGHAGFCDITPFIAQMEGNLIKGSAVSAPDLPSAVLAKENGDELYVIDTTEIENTGYDDTSQILYNFRPLYLQSKTVGVGITGVFKYLEIMRARMSLEAEREGRYL